MRKVILFLVLALLLLIAPYRRWAIEAEHAGRHVLIWLNLTEPPQPRQPPPQRPEPPAAIDDWVIWD